MSEAEPKQNTPKTEPPSPNATRSPGAAPTMAEAEATAAPGSPRMPAPTKELAPSTVLHAAISGQLELLDKIGSKTLAAIRGEDGMTPLLAAVHQGSPTTVLHLVQTLRADLSSTLEGASGLTCLHLAAERLDRGTMLEVLLGQLKDHEGMPDVNVCDEQKFTPLHLACILGNLEGARCLLRHGADPGPRNDRGSTPLHWACSRGHTKIVKLLVGVYGEDFACPADNGSTPLHWAASRNMLPAMRLLLGTYCAQVEVKNDKGCTAAFVAASNGHQKALELLVDKYKAKVTTHDKKRTGLLHAACENGHTEMATMLVERHKLGLEEEDRKGLTALARAALKNQVATFKLLVDRHGARLSTQTARGSGLLHVACEGGAMDVSKMLLQEYGFEVDARNVDGDTPLLLAASRGHVEMISLLIEQHGADVGAVDARGAGVLHKACQANQRGVVSVLLKRYGLSVDRADPSGATPLHLVARSGDATLVELLVGSGSHANPCVRDRDGNLALHIAVAAGCLEVVKIMVQAGADVAAGDSSGKNALDLAVSKGDTEIVEFLRKALPDGEEKGDRGRGRSKAGFQRAGRWMGLVRGDAWLNDVSLENVFLLPIATLLKLGRFPSNYDATRKKLLVRASDASPYARVLLVSHPCELPGNPDPSGRQFSALRRFLKESRTCVDGEARGDGESEIGGESEFGYAWMAFSCTSSNRIKPTFKTHLHNVVTAWCLADHALVLPEMVPVRHLDGVVFTDLKGYVGRGWCCVELLCAAHLGVPITVHMALGSAELSGTTSATAAAAPAREIAALVSATAPSPQGAGRAGLFTMLRQEAGGSGGDEGRGQDHDRPRFGSVFELLPSPLVSSLKSGDASGDGLAGTADTVPVGALLSRVVEVASGKLCSLVLHSAGDEGEARVAETGDADRYAVDPDAPWVPKLPKLPSLSLVSSLTSSLSSSSCNACEQTIDGSMGSSSSSPVPTFWSGLVSSFISSSSSPSSLSPRPPPLPPPSPSPPPPPSLPPNVPRGSPSPAREEIYDRLLEGKTSHSSAVWSPAMQRMPGCLDEGTEGLLGSDGDAEFESVLIVADLLWSADAEMHIDNVTNLVRTLLRTLHGEVSTKGSQGPAKEIAEKVLVKGTTHGCALDARRETSASRLLTRILSVALNKSDLGEDVTEGGGKGRGGSWTAGSVCGMLRELHDKVGNCSSAHEKIDVLNVLLLASCYCRPVCRSSGESMSSLSSKSSPRRVRRGSRGPPVPAVRSSVRRRRSHSPGPVRGGDVGDPRAAVADSVPSCRTS